MYCKIEFCNKEKSYCFHHDTAYPVDSIKKDPYKKKIRGTSRPSRCRKIADRLRSEACRNKYSMTNVSDESISASRKTMPMLSGRQKDQWGLSRLVTRIAYKTFPDYIC